MGIQIFAFLAIDLLSVLRVYGSRWSKEVGGLFIGKPCRIKGWWDLDDEFWVHGKRRRRRLSGRDLWMRTWIPIGRGRLPAQSYTLPDHFMTVRDPEYKLI